jgi:hypothetical protein
MDKIYLTNIFIVDWDDTLFPTNWITKNQIDITNINSINKYKLFFIELDKILAGFINNMNNFGTVYIISNASLSWLKNCLNILPGTRNVVMKNNIRLISARDIYSPKYQSTMEWKVSCFQDVLSEVLNKLYGKINNNNYLNIMSFGDANYEYIALLNLDKFFKLNNPNINYLLKNVKFMEKPDFNFIIEQISVLNKNLPIIVNQLNFVDLNLEIS